MPQSRYNGRETALQHMEVSYMPKRRTQAIPQGEQLRFRPLNAAIVAQEYRSLLAGAPLDESAYRRVASRLNRWIGQPLIDEVNGDLQAMIE